MDEREWLAERFEEQRPHLRAVAYRMLGSLSEADDAVQEAWLRLSRTDASEVENLGGWLTTVVARVSLNMLRSRATRREEPLGVHLPDPIVDSADGTDPEHEALLADSVGLALLIVLETLNPPERLAFVLHDMFAVPYDEIAPIIESSPMATRQLASRARRRLQGERTATDAAVLEQHLRCSSCGLQLPISPCGRSSSRRYRGPALAFRHPRPSSSHPPARLHRVYSVAGRRSSSSECSLPTARAASRWIEAAGREWSRQSGNS